MFLAIASALAALAALPKCIKALWLFFWHGPVASSMKQIGKTVLKAMVQAEIIETDISQLRVIARKLDYGFVGCSLKGGTTRDRSIFLEAMQEVLGPVENPRYVLVRKSTWDGSRERTTTRSRRPSARTRKRPSSFARIWSLRVGPADLVYTRTPEGRRFLLKARARSMAQGFQRRAERLKVWQ